MPELSEPETISWQEAVKRLVGSGDNEAAENLFRAVADGSVQYYPRRAIPLERALVDIHTGAWRNHARDNRPFYIPIIRESFERYFRIGHAGPQPAIGAPLRSREQTAKQQPKKPNRPSGKKDRAGQAITAIWPDGPPDSRALPNGLLCKSVIEWITEDCKKRGLPHHSISNDTILRAAGRLK